MRQFPPTRPTLLTLFTVASMAMAGSACGENDPGVQPSPDAAPEPDATPAIVCNDDDPASSLSEIEGIVAQEADCGDFIGDPTARCFVVTIEQPIDHADPSAATFSQRLHLVHRSCSAPTIIDTNGYNNPDGIFFEGELGVTYGTNSILQEHRFVGSSTPSLNEFLWDQLTIENAAGDTHRILETLRDHYTGNWVTTGASKGGVTALYHGYFYPDDADGSIPYVAPASRGRIDPEYQVFMDTIGSDTCRESIRSHQLEVLNRRVAMSAIITAEFGLPAAQADETLEFLTTRVEWAFWQRYGTTSCGAVPTAEATDQQHWEFLAAVLGIQSGARGGAPPDAARDSYVFTYEWLAEQGFADQIGDHLADAMVHTQPTMAENFEADAPTPLPAYDPSVTLATRTWAATQAKNTILIYGENDPWTGGQIDTPTDPTSAKFIVPDANHGAGIGALPPAERQQALEMVSRILGKAPIAGQRIAAQAAHKARMEFVAKQQLAVERSVTALMIERLRRAAGK